MTELRWLLSISFQCLTPRVSAAISSIYALSNFFAQQPGETSHDYTLCFSTAAAAAPPSASHPQRPRRDGAVSCGSERPRRRGRAADLCRGQGGRGRHLRPWPRKGFRVVLGVALTRWLKGFVHWQVICLLCFGMLSGICCLNNPLLCWDGRLGIWILNTPKLILYKMPMLWLYKMLFRDPFYRGLAWLSIKCPSRAPYFIIL